MANQWFYTQGEEQKGPVSSEELKQLAAAGQLSPDDLIWKEGLDDWKPASQLKGLFPGGAAAAPAAGAGATLAVSSPVVDVGDAGAVSYASSRSRGRGDRSALWQIPHLVAAVLLCTAMFLPWWSLHIEGDYDDFKVFYKKDDEKRNRWKLNPAKTKAFYRDQGRYFWNWAVLSISTDSNDETIGQFDAGQPLSIIRRFNPAYKPEDDTAKKKARLYTKISGWHIGAGMGAGIIGFALLPWAIVLMLSAGLRKYSWIASFLLAYAGFLLGMFTLMWYIECPGYDVPPVLSQGAHAGPYLALSGTLLLLIFGLIDGLSGFAAFRRSR